MAVLPAAIVPGTRRPDHGQRRGDAAAAVDDAGGALRSVGQQPWSGRAVVDVMAMLAVLQWTLLLAW
jgi:hypothetical protein